MKMMRVYFLCDHDLGLTPTIEPRVPKTKAALEDYTTPRICVATTIPACLKSIDAIPILCDLDRKDPCKENEHHVITYEVYVADVPVEHIVQPDNSMVPDAWITGELWITEPTVFHKLGTAQLEKHVVYEDAPFARFAFTMLHDPLSEEFDDEVVDRVFADAIYGEYGAFSILDFDQYRAEQFIANTTDDDDGCAHAKFYRAKHQRPSEAPSLDTIVKQLITHENLCHFYPITNRGQVWPSVMPDGKELWGYLKNYRGRDDTESEPFLVIFRTTLLTLVNKLYPEFRPQSDILDFVRKEQHDYLHPTGNVRCKMSKNIHGHVSITAYRMKLNELPIDADIIQEYLDTLNK